MRICAATNKGGLEDTVLEIFGRCPTYTFVEVEGKKIKDAEIVQNQFAMAAGGAGIQASQFVAGKGANVVIGGNYGPNALPILNQAGIKVVSAFGMTVKDAVTKYLNGELQEISQPTRSSYAGMPAGGMGRAGGAGRGGGFGRGHGGAREAR